MFGQKSINHAYFLYFLFISICIFPIVPLKAQDDSTLTIEGDLIGQGYIKVYSIKFLDNPVIIKKESFPVIDSIATLLLKNPRVRVEVASYAEKKEGVDEKSIMDIEYRKAKAVCNHLAYKGVTETRYTCKGYTFQKQNDITEPIPESTIDDTSSLGNNGTNTEIKDSTTTIDSTAINQNKPIIPQDPKHSSIDRPRIEFRIISR
jgi:hypothetical protein